MHALVIGGQILSVGRLPRAARDLTSGEWVTPPDGQWTDALAATVGYLPVADTPHPADDTTDWFRSVELVGGVPTVVWTAEPWSADEVSARSASVNESTLRADAAAQIATLLASIDTLQAVTDKANNQLGPADTKTVARETRRVARQLVRLTRLIVGALDSSNAGPE